MKLLRLIFCLPAIACVVLMRLLWPWVRIRIGDIWSPRIGHMLGNMECYMCERDAGKHKALDLWYHRKPISNRQAAKMLNRCLHVDRTGFLMLVDLCNRMFRGWEKHVAESAQCDRDIYNLMEKYSPHLKFTASEERRGARELRKMGIPEGAKWVCLIVRDGAYLPQLRYHRHRDSDPDTYIPAALELVQRGYYVVRMGAKVSGPLKVKHSKIIDYATNGGRSDFMDMYLGAKCAFCVSNCTGFDAIPTVFRRPIVYVNQVPIEYLMTFVPQSLAIWKHHYKEDCDNACKAQHMSGYEVLHIGKRKRMTPTEIYAANAGQFMQAEEYEAAGITLEDNSPQEILDAVVEMDNRLHVEVPMSGYEILNVETPRWHDEQPFWRSFPRSISPYNGVALHGAIRMRIGREFLKGYA